MRYEGNEGKESDVFELGAVLQAQLQRSRRRASTVVVDLPLEVYHDAVM